MKRTALLIAGIIAMIASALSVPSSASSSAAAGCGTVTAGQATCYAERIVATSLATKSATPAGYSPADIRSAYSLSATAGKGRTVAVIVAYNDPSAERDLAIYRAKFKLSACTSANGCFRKVNQRGGSALPKTNAAWAGEASLDIEMVSAACASCKILLVQADTSSMSDLASAVNYAATQKVSAISNSYGSSDSTANSAYDHPGIAIVAASGDSGYGGGAPASFKTVIAVGGTTLKRANNARGWTETAWNGGGSMCSTQNAKPAWQTSVTKCSGKAVTDVSAVADPNTGLAAYVGTPYAGVSGWQVFGGTSAAAPIVAGVYAMSGRTSGYPAAYTWTHTAGLNDVTSGSNGKCSTARWCTSAKGWDGPTGLGSPRGTSSF